VVRSGPTTGVRLGGPIIEIRPSQGLVRTNHSRVVIILRGQVRADDRVIKRSITRVWIRTNHRG
jgi:hypothetical protein